MSFRIRDKRFSALATLLSLGLGFSACTPPSGGTKGPQEINSGCEGKCDGVAMPSGYEADFGKLNELFDGETPMEKIEDAFSVTIKLGDKTLAARTHLFGGPVNVIPYSNDDEVTDAAGEAVERGDDIIAKYFKPGDVGFMIKHHRPEHRELAFEGNGMGMKEHFKLQDTHIGIVVGVERDGKDGAITLNNPQGYEGGKFGTPNYPMIFVKPTFPAYIGLDEQKLFNDNIRSMMVAFNAISEFPGDYNGGDPLAARTPELLKIHVEKMVRAITGDAEARAWFKQPENMIYCAELAHVAASAGMLFPLNKATIEPLVGEELWTKFVGLIKDHNDGKETAFTSLNANKRAALVKMTVAPDSLLAVPEYAPEERKADALKKLAFQPMTMSDIVEQFLRTHIPREQVGEALAPVQGMILEKMKPGLLEAMAMDQVPVDNPARQLVEGLFAQIVDVVKTPYADYDAFRAAVEPVLEKARQVTGPRSPDSGVGLFVPPSLMHVVAQKKHNGGLLGLKVVGHGLHYSVVKKSVTQ